MNVISENSYELNIINNLKSKGFQYLTEEEIIKLRGGEISEVLLISKIEESLQKLNKGITQQNINKVILKLKDLKETDLISANKEFHKFIIEGVKIYDDNERRTISYKIFNGEDDDWIVTNQFKLTTSHPNYNNQYPDIVIYCNGLPVIIFELKTIKEQETLEKPWQQIKNYQTYLKDLFIYNFFNVISNVSEMKFGSITSSLQRYQYWRGDDFSNQDPENLLNDLFLPGKIYDLITNFTFFTSEEPFIKIISSYHQYYGVKLAIDSSRAEINRVNKEGNGKAGIFWHTQGSGKSFSMLFLVMNIAKKVPGTTFVIVTDRNDLDNQLYQTFEKASEFINQKIHQISSISDLKEQLKGRKQDGVYFTTVQKFTADVKELSERDNILVITDEAHRSHNNIEGFFEFDSEKNTMVEKQGNAAYLRDAFPKATFIGFTGTPIDNEDKSTIKIFGKIITKYLMTDAERDGVVVPIRYESRKPELVLDENELAKLNIEYDEVVDGIAKESNIPNEAIKKVNKSLQEIKNIIGDPDRIEGISEDFIEHYKLRSGSLRGKAMFVAFNRHIAFEYYKKIIELAPELKDNIKLIITNSNGQNDPQELIDAAGSKEYRKRMASEFKKEDSDFKIAIVVDMWLTGFDVPSLDVIYLDKPIKMHNLMQTVARTNRVYTKDSLNKDYGLVVDYIGLWKKLNEALAFYSGRNEFDTKTERNLKELKPVYLENINNIYEFFKLTIFINVNKLIDDEQFRIETLRKATSVIIENRDQQEFISKTKKVSVWFKEILSIINEKERILFQMLMVIRSHIIKIELGHLNLKSKTDALKDTLSNVIKFDKTVIIDEIKGDAILLSDIIKFIDEELEDGTQALDIYEKISATRKLLQLSRKINIRKSEDLSKKLNELLERYDGNYISIEELFSGIRLIAEEANNLHSKSKNEMGYSQEELAFFKIISQPFEQLESFDQEKINKIMSDLLGIVNDDKKVNTSWIYNEQLKAKVRGELTILLLENEYPPEDSKIASEDIIEQIMHQKNYKGR